MALSAVELKALWLTGLPKQFFRVHRGHWKVLYIYISGFGVGNYQCRVRNVDVIFFVVRALVLVSVHKKLKE